MGKPLLLFWLAATLGWTGCLALSAPEVDPQPVRPSFLSGDSVLARAAMDSLDMPGRIAQLMMVPLYSSRANLRCERRGSTHCGFRRRGRDCHASDKRNTARCAA